MSRLQSAPIERKFFVNDMTIAAQQWGVGNKHRVIALHGWLDNSASFCAIAPLIEDCEIVALDFAGNGESDHRNQHASYNIWDDLLDILAIADALEWPSFQLLTHSRGAFVGLLLAASMPERVERLLMLDCALSLDTKETDAPKNLSRYLRDQRSYYQKPSRLMASIDEAVERRIVKVDLSAEECLPIAERAIAPAKGFAEKGGYVWRHDPRAAGGSAFKLSDFHQQAFLAALDIPCLMILAKEGLFDWEQSKAAVKGRENITMILHDGGHHMHMQTQHCQSLALKATNFFTD